MKSLSKSIESKMRIQYHDCDPFNHLNNSRYIDYMVAARTEQLKEQYELDIAAMAQEKGLGWVIAQTQISYFFPAVWMELVTIQSRLIKYSESSVMVEFTMWDEQKTKLKSMMWAKFVHFNIKTQRSQTHTEELMKLFAEVISPLESNPSFEERVKSFR